MNAGASSRPERAGRAMAPERLLQERRKEVLRICAKRGAHDVRVFGPLTRGDMVSPPSLTPGGACWTTPALRLELQELLGRPQAGLAAIHASILPVRGSLL